MKAQIFSIDLIIGVSILITILSTILFIDTYTLGKIEATKNSLEMDITASSIANVLARTGGNLTGLTNDENVLEGVRLNNFLASNYTDTKENLGAIDSELHIQFFDTNGQFSEFGSVPRNKKSSSMVERILLYNGNPVLMRVTAWVSK